ncbi:8392_t:CDS:2, partial [Racocetra persica]
QHEESSVTNSFDIVDSDITKLVKKYLTFEDNGLEEFNNIYTAQTESIEHYKNNENSSPIFISEDIPDSVRFNIWDEVECYFNEYRARNRFAVTKYQIE